MKLPEYLKQRDEKQAAFARRAKIPQTTVNEICQGKGTRSETAIKIIRVTGGLVSLEDLCGKGDEGATAA